MLLFLFLGRRWRATRSVERVIVAGHLTYGLIYQPVPYHTLVRTIATARIVLPYTIIRLAAGRDTLSESEQAMCFMAGANAVFTGEQMLTTPCKSARLINSLVLSSHCTIQVPRGMRFDCWIAKSFRH